MIQENIEPRRRDIVLDKLTERAKELKCIYKVIEILRDEDAELNQVLKAILDVIPPGWQHPTVCEARIILEGKKYASVDFRETEWMLRSEIVIDNHVSGEVQVVYLQKVFESDQPFLPEEQRLLNAIADHLSRYIFQRRLKKTMEMQQAVESGAEPASENSLFAYESDEHWKWRMQIAEKIACRIDFERFGIEAIYVIGSTKNASAGPGSDIDLLIHFRGDDRQEELLKAWLEGWGLGLAELNYQKTGYRTTGSLVDYHLVTDKDIKDKTSYAVMIGASDNSARLLRCRKE